MAADTVSLLDALYKQVNEDKVANVGYSDFPLIDWLTKKERAFGNGLKVPVIYGDSAAVSCSDSVGYSDIGGTQSAAFTVTPATYYGSDRITGLAIASADSKEAAFGDVVETKVMGVRNQLLRRISAHLFRSTSNSGVAVLAQIDATSGTSTTITLDNAEDTANFFKNQRIQLSADGSTLLNSSTLTVSGVSRAAGTITTGAALSSISGAAGYYILSSGDSSGAVTGLPAYITTSTSPASLWGMTRTNDVDRLSGAKVNASGKELDEALVDLVTEVAFNSGGLPDAIFVNHYTMAALIKLAMGGCQFLAPFNKADIGFKGVQVLAPGGVVPVIQDRFCPSSVAYALTKDSMKLQYQGGSLIHTPMDAGEATTVWDQVSGLDQYILRMRSFCQLVVNNPAANGVVYNLNA